MPISGEYPKYPTVWPLLDTITINILSANTPGQWISIEEHLCRNTCRCFLKTLPPLFTIDIQLNYIQPKL